MRWNPELGVPLRAQLVRTWVAATNAGGALGFLPPVDEAAIAPTAQTQFLRVGSGTDDLLVVEVDAAVAGWLVLERDPRTFAAHWRTLKRLQVHPSRQGQGLGRALLHEAERFAREELDLEFLLLTVRGGTGTETLYRRAGYQEVGRTPRAMRVGTDDYRDEITMVLALR